MTEQQNPFANQSHEESSNNIDLSEFDDDFKAAEPADFDEVPDGKYQVRVESVKLAESSNGNPMIKWDLVVISGQYEGRHVFKNSVITRESLPFVKGDLKVLGVEPAKLSDLPVYFETLLDQKLNITKRTKGEYTNVYFNSLIEMPQAPNQGGMPF